MQHPYLATTRPDRDAADLLTAFGVDAAAQAAQRAEHSCGWATTSISAAGGKWRA